MAAVSSPGNYGHNQVTETTPDKELNKKCDGYESAYHHKAVEYDFVKSSYRSVKFCSMNESFRCPVEGIFLIKSSTILCLYFILSQVRSA